ncbi:MAG TPA: hypothetical protein DEO88_16210 [Syntrophobacteraceae bacterium]|nr:hypothetical protein [Syntrophobacteraceae bacterium]
MKTPPLLIGGSLLFWGWQVGHLNIAAVSAVLVEAARLVRWRWDFSVREGELVVRICMLLFLGVVVYSYFSQASEHPILTGLGWVPVALLPLVVIQEYGSEGQILLGGFSWLPKLKHRDKVTTPRVIVNVAPFYALVCVGAASTANIRGFGFYAGMVGITAWALVCTRPKRLSLVPWGILLALVVTAGYVGQIGLHQLQGLVERKIGDLIEGFFEDTDPYQTHTAIGDRGKLKVSDRIVLRVEPQADGVYPTLLHEASYNRVAGTSWVAWESPLKTVAPGATTAAWKLDDHPGIGRTVTISAYPARGKGVLALPRGSFRIEHLSATGVKCNRFGTVRVEGCPHLFKYLVHYDPETTVEAPPDAGDLEVPPAEAAALERFLAQEGLTGRTASDAAGKLHSLFQTNFKYSLSQPTSLGNAQSGDSFHLERFLFDTRAGHCEYFATATVLLLRQMKVPARYATGYSIQEFSKRENLFVVRAKHAHAWARLFLDGRWHDLDTTPASWANIEAEAAPWWQSLYDLCSQGIFRFSQWRLTGGIHEALGYMAWLVVPLCAVAAWKLARRKPRASSRRVTEADTAAAARCGSDSEFYLIVKRISKHGYPLLPGETLEDWLRRLEDCSPWSTEVTTQLHSLLALHYRYRFDPGGITAQQRSDLKRSASMWLSQTEV